MIKISLVFKASAEDLFCAWTDPAIMIDWLFKEEGSAVESVDADVAVGGQFSIVTNMADGPIDHFGNYLLVDKPIALAFTLDAPKLFSGSAQIFLDFKQMDVGCEMTFQQSDAGLAETAWRKMFAQLTMVLLHR